MGLWDRFFGPPSRDKFATQFMAALRAAGDSREVRYDANEFRLVHGKHGSTNLGNFYMEYCALPWAKRKKCLHAQVRGALSHLKEMPDEFEDAKYDLRPKIWARVSLEKVRLRHELEGGTPTEIPSQLIGEHLEAILAYDFPEAVRSISQDDLDGWGVNYYEAMEVARHNLQASDFTFAAIGDHLYASMTGDTYDATRLLMLDLIRQLQVQGEHIAMVPNRDTLLVTGSDDVVGLTMMVTLAEKALKDEPRPMIATPLQLVGDEWVDWMPPEDHPLFAQLRTMELKWLFDEYGEQKKIFEALHERDEIDIFVASYSAVEKKSGELVSYCVWSNGVDTLLPKAQKVVFSRGEKDMPALASWEKVMDVVGDLMEPTDHYPVRYRVREFPTDAQLAAIGMGDL